MRSVVEEGSPADSDRILHVFHHWVPVINQFPAYSNYLLRLLSRSLHTNSIVSVTGSLRLLIPKIGFPENVETTCDTIPKPGIIKM